MVCTSRSLDLEQAHEHDTRYASSQSLAVTTEHIETEILRESMHTSPASPSELNRSNRLISMLGWSSNSAYSRNGEIGSIPCVQTTWRTSGNEWTRLWPILWAESELPRPLHRPWSLTTPRSFSLSIRWPGPLIFHDMRNSGICRRL